MSRTAQESVFILVLLLLGVGQSLAAVVHQENFETDGQGVRYTASTPFNDGVSDHWNRTDGSDISNSVTPYSGQDGTFYWAAEDVDDDGGNGQDEQSLDITGIIISGHTNLQFTGLFAADGISAGIYRYDPTDHLRVQYQVDGGGFQNGVWFQSEPPTLPDTSANNERILQDTDFDGIGDGAQLVPGFVQFGFSIPDGSTLDLRVLVQGDAASEELAFDALHVSGDIGCVPTTEICNGLDDNCNGSADEGLSVDFDGDGHYTPASCFLPADDCDDLNPSRFPGNTETCDGIDNDCDGVVPFDETDDDGDGQAECHGDCDDTDDGRFLGNAEVCDGVDSDCDGVLPTDETDPDGDDIAECEGDNCPDDSNRDQTDFNGDGIGDACTPCTPDPLGQGYWHRQCLGVPAVDGGIDPERNVRGPQEPLEPGFIKRLMDPVSDVLADKMFEFDGACAGGMDASPAGDPCAKAIKRTTALLFNLTAGRLSGSCQLDPSSGCDSTNLVDLVDELAALINSGSPANCQQASACASAANDGQVSTEASVLDSELQATPPEEDTQSPEVTEMVVPEQAAPPHQDAAQVTVPLFVGVAPEAEPDGAAPLKMQARSGSLERLLAVLSNPSAPQEAVDSSTATLLTILSGGYDLEVRLGIINSLLPRIDVGYHALLAGHLEDIHTEADHLGKDDLAGRTARLLGQLEDLEE